MSKKVLKLAGQQPMLLAVIMAAITITLLFSNSGPVPTVSHAQTSSTNPPPNIEITNCPSYTTNLDVSCPAITNGEDLAPLTFCVELGNTLPDPTWVSQPGATPGQVVTTITETCSNTVSSTTNPVTYSFSWHYQTPPGKPAKPTTAGRYSATAVGVISSSDTNNCPDPAAPTWSVTWKVIDTNANLYIRSFPWTSDFSLIANNFVAGWFDLGHLSPINEIDTTSDKRFCCNDTSALWHYHEVKVDGGTQTINATLKSKKVTDVLGKAVNSILTAIGAADNAGAATGITDYITNRVAEGSIGVTCTVKANYSKIDYQNDCYCSNRSFSDVFFGNKGISFEFTPLSFYVPQSVVELFGINGPISLDLFKGNASYDITGSDPVSSNSSNVTHEYCEKASGDFYIAWQFGTISDKYSMGPNNATNSSPSVLCETGMH
jgi:hypothetical protein